jgi:hypothetical protein
LHHTFPVYSRAGGAALRHFPSASGYEAKGGVMSSLGRFLHKNDPIGTKLIDIDPISKKVLGSSDDHAPGGLLRGLGKVVATAAADLAPEQGRQFETLRQKNIAAAEAAGVTRASDADLLGVGNKGPKRRNASRMLLGE